MSGISLNSGIRASLTQLSRTTAAFDQTTNRLATGKKVSSAIDNPTNFFASVNLNDRAEGLSSRLDSMGQAVQRIQAADNGISTVRSYISAMKGVVNNALGNTDANARTDLGKQFNELIKQIGTAAADSGYQGINLLQTSGNNGESETVQFNETFDQSTLEVKGFSMQAGTYNSATGAVSGVSASAVTGVTTVSIQGISTSVDQAALILATQDSNAAIGIQAYDAAGMTNASSAEAAGINWGAAGDGYKDLLADVITQLEAYDEELKTQASALANNLSTITTREEFSTNMINTLTEGADKLTLADLNEEGANLLALQTQNQLATQSLSLASQQSQSVLQLIG
jgi:flagellin-like hook-associated protein FlgL